MSAIVAAPSLAPAARSTTPPTSLSLGLEGVGFAVRGKALLEGVDLVLAPARCTVIMGPNGAGKSLLLRLAHGLVEPTAGRVVWAGGKPGRHAMLFQRPVMLRRTARANIRHALALAGHGLAARRRLADAAIARFGLEALAERPARSLSGGEQQVLALARAASLEPDLLFLDEPTSALDPAATARIEAMLLTLARDGVTLVLVTHSLGQARRFADDVVFLHRGRLIEKTSAADFFTGPRSDEARAFINGELFW